MHVALFMAMSPCTRIMQAHSMPEDTTCSYCLYWHMKYIAEETMACKKSQALEEKNSSLNEACQPNLFSCGHSS